RSVRQSRFLIAVVDDDASMRESLTTLLQGLGCSVRAFASAQLFLASDAVGDIHCLVADIAMRGMSGYDLQSELKDRGFDIPTIFMTGPADELRPTGVGSAPVAILSKPFSEVALLRSIDTALG